MNHDDYWELWDVCIYCGMKCSVWQEHNDAVREKQQKANGQGAVYASACPKTPRPLSRRLPR